MDAFAAMPPLYFCACLRHNRGNSRSCRSSKNDSACAAAVGLAKFCHANLCKANFNLCCSFSNASCRAPARGVGRRPLSWGQPDHAVDQVQFPACQMVAPRGITRGSAFAAHSTWKLWEEPSSRPRWAETLYKEDLGSSSPSRGRLGRVEAAWHLYTSELDLTAAKMYPKGFSRRLWTRTIAAHVQTSNEVTREAASQGMERRQRNVCW